MVLNEIDQPLITIGQWCYMPQMPPSAIIQCGTVYVRWFYCHSFLVQRIRRCWAML